MVNPSYKVSLVFSTTPLVLELARLAVKMSLYALALSPGLCI
jgi:hypothetical protein